MSITNDKKCRKKAGVVINPGTPVESLLPVLEIVDYVLVMTVNPGFGGRKSFMKHVQQSENFKRFKTIIKFKF